MLDVCVHDHTKQVFANATESVIKAWHIDIEYATCCGFRAANFAHATPHLSAMHGLFLPAPQAEIPKF